MGTLDVVHVLCLSKSTNRATVVVVPMSVQEFFTLKRHVTARFARIYLLYESLREELEERGLRLWAATVAARQVLHFVYDFGPGPLG